MDVTEILTKYNLPVDNRITAMKLLRELIQGSEDPLKKAQEVIKDFGVQVDDTLNSDPVRARLAAAAIVEFAIKNKAESKLFDPAAAGAYVVERAKVMEKSFPSAFVEGKTKETEGDSNMNTQTATVEKTAKKTANGTGKRGPRGDIIQKITDIYNANKDKELKEIAKIVMAKVKDKDGQPLLRGNVYSRLYTVRQRAGVDITPKGKPAGRKAAGRKASGRTPAKRARKK